MEASTSFRQMRGNREEENDGSTGKLRRISRDMEQKKDREKKRVENISSSKIGGTFQLVVPQANRLSGSFQRLGVASLYPSRLLEPPVKFQGGHL